MLLQATAADALIQLCKLHLLFVPTYLGKLIVAFPQASTKKPS